MPALETVAIINKSGKVVSTSKHLINIFRDAKDAYASHKAELKNEYRMRHEEKAAQKRLEALRLSDNLIEQRPRSHRSSSSRHERPPLTADNLSRAGGSVSGSRHGSRAGSRRARSVKDGGARSPPPTYREPYSEEAEFSRPDLTRRHTEIPGDARTQITRRASADRFGPPARSYSSPNMADDYIDMNLAYGELHGHEDYALEREEKQLELSGLMTKLDTLMLEAQCVQHSATTIISSLQKNPEAMAAVALTLAEISNLLTKMSPGILSTVKAASPAVFALLASPQFLIAGGLAVGVTIVMFGGYKIVKRIQENHKREKEEAMRMDEALAYEGELSSIESWRRGIADVEERSVATSVDGEFITPEAQRIRKERIRERAREEVANGAAAMGPRSEISVNETGRKRSEKSRLAEVETVVSGYSERSARTESTVKPKREKKEKSKGSSGKEKDKDRERERERERKMIKDKEKGKKGNALAVLFKKSGDKKEKSHKQPLMLEM